MYLVPEGNASVTFNDLPYEEGLAWAKKMPGHATISFAGKLTSTSHYDIPITYVLCTNDQVIPPSHQQKMIDDMKQVSRSTVEVVELDSGHVPHMVHPDESVNIVMKAAGGT